MRSIAHFPTGANRKRGRRIPTSDADNNSSNNNWGQPAPVWGRSAAAVVKIASSPSNSSYGSSNSSSSISSKRSSSRSPIPQSPTWGRSARASIAATRSPRQTQKVMPKNQPSLQSPLPTDVHIDEVTISTARSQKQRQLVAPLRPLSLSPKRSRSPKRSHDLCTIVEGRKISSNTLSKMAITSTAEQIAKSPVLAKPRPQQQREWHRQYQENLARMQRNSNFRDPYNDDSYDDDQDCADCWAYHRAGFQKWWTLWKRSEKTKHNKLIISTSSLIDNNSRNINAIGFSTSSRRSHVRRTSF